MRVAFSTELPAVICALKKLQDKSAAPQMPFSNLDKAGRSILKWIEAGDAWIVGDYFVAVTKGTMWYSEEPMIFEHLVIRLYNSNKNPISTVTDFLKALCVTEGCAAVIVGDAQFGRMIPVYKDAGFSEVGTQLIWSP
jgi:hypothetical protein